jgi:GT2 family glycosyltransferase
MNQILCVVLHYGSEEDTNICLKSLHAEEGLDIVVSDNDPAQSYSLPMEFSHSVKIIKTGGQAGFSEGNNIAVNAFLSGKHDSIFILNNDTMVEYGAIKLLRKCLFDSDSIGAVGPRMPYADLPDKIWACGGFINRRTLAVGGLQPSSHTPYEVDYLPGAAILTRADLWKKIGGLSEKYFLAYEEAEYALEVKRLGYKVIVAPQSVILHKVGMSSQIKPEYFYNSIRNRLIFSKYLYGKSIGFIYGLFITMISLKAKNPFILFRRSRLWLEAVIDELRSKPFNKQRLKDIALRYEKLYEKVH